MRITVYHITTIDFSPATHYAAFFFFCFWISWTPKVMLSNLPRVVQNVIIVDWSKISNWNCLSIRISHSEFCMQQCTCLLYTQKNSYCYFKAPGEPSNLSLVNRTDSTITLSWSKPVNQNGIIVKYTVSEERNIDVESYWRMNYSILLFLTKPIRLTNLTQERSYPTPNIFTQHSAVLYDTWG